VRRHAKIRDAAIWSAPGVARLRHCRVFHPEARTAEAIALHPPVSATT